MADSQRKSYNLFDITGETSFKSSWVDIVNSSFNIRKIESGYITRIKYTDTYEAGTYTISFKLTGDLANVRLLTSIQISGSQWNDVYGAYWITVTDNVLTFTANAEFTIGFQFNGTANGTGTMIDVMLNTGQTAKPYEPYGWVHSLRKLTTATEAVENPLYSDGTAITSYTIKGNTVQNGTPTPSNPVEVNGVGERTENLFDISQIQANKYITSGGDTGNSAVSNLSDYCDISGTEHITLSYNYQTLANPSDRAYCFYTSSKNIIPGANYNPSNQTTIINVPSNAQYIRFAYDINVDNIMLNTGSTAKSYEPYGQYKIPISSGGVTTNIYLGSTQTVRQINKLVLTGDEYWVYQANNLRFVMTIDNIVVSGLRATPFFCTHYIPISDGRPIEDVPLNASYLAEAATNTATLNIKIDTYTTAADFKAYLAAQYANGTPVTVWYILSTAETAAVNEPLMKIGTYADSISNAAQIPTTEGANSITVDTTVQPSEFTATWTGWHDASVKEKSENLFNTFDIVGQVPSISNGQLINYNGSTTSLIPIISGNITVTKPPTALLYLLLYAADMSYIGYVQNSTDANFYGSSVTGYENAKYCRLRIDRTTGLDDIQIMINTGSTALPYEPYWK